MDGAVVSKINFKAVLMNTVNVYISVIAFVCTRAHACTLRRVIVGAHGSTQRKATLCAHVITDNV